MLNLTSGGAYHARKLASALQHRFVQTSALWKNSGFIDGNWVRDGKPFPVHDPANNDVIAEFPDMTKKDAVTAIEAADRCFTSSAWKESDANQRADWLEKIAELHSKHVDELAKMLSMESGKPLSEAKGEIMYGASYFKYYSDLARTMQWTETLESSNSSPTLQVVREPVGVCALITPWNFPNAMLSRKLAAALAAGCTAVAKPASETPLSALALAQLCKDAGVPDGAFNVVVTHAHTKDIGNVMTSHPKVRKVSFTGSTQVGKHLMAQSANTVKKVSLELGGNAPFIVFDDADLDLAVKGLMASKFRNAGQTCVSANRIFVQEAVYDRFMDLLWEKVKILHVGHGLDENTEVGPLISQTAVLRVNDLLDDAVAHGSKVRQVELDSEFVNNKLVSSGLGNFVLPALVDCANPSMKVYSEEIFGPIVCMIPFGSEDEVIQMANDTTAGLASYLFSSSNDRLSRVSKALEYGMVGCNTGMISNAKAPFGGVKESGLGREGSKYGLDDYTEIKYVCTAV